MTSRQYDLFLTRPQKFAVAVPLILLCLFPMFSFLLFSNMPAGAEPPFNRFVLPLLFVAFFGFYVASALFLPYRISVTRDRQLVFKSVLRTRMVRVADLLSIAPKNLNVQAGVSGYVLEHRGGKIRFPGQFTDQYLLLYELKQANPALATQGC